ncbi:hypothetical protein C0J52_24868 [Blattella germanica]|nr:hypothetical protein C0J52_24868 [Blattella germanica]
MIQTAPPHTSVNISHHALRCCLLLMNRDSPAQQSGLCATPCTLCTVNLISTSVNVEVLTISSTSSEWRLLLKDRDGELMDKRSKTVISTKHNTRWDKTL